MKIRWSKNGVRFRITPSELESLQRGEVVSESVEIGRLDWFAAITPHRRHEIEAMQGHFVIRLSRAELAELADPANEGVYFTTDDETPVRYCIEKDFPCAHPRSSEANEPASETFAPTPDFEQRKQQN